MDSIIKSDIFFLITSVFVVFLGILASVVLIYLARILSDVKKLSKKIKNEGENIIDDVGDLRENIKKNTIKLSDILTFKFFRQRKEKKGKNYKQ